MLQGERRKRHFLAFDNPLKLPAQGYLQLVNTDADTNVLPILIFLVSQGMAKIQP